MRRGDLDGLASEAVFWLALPQSLGIGREPINRA